MTWNELSREPRQTTVLRIVKRKLLTISIYLLVLIYNYVAELRKKAKSNNLVPSDNFTIERGSCMLLLGCISNIGVHVISCDVACLVIDHM